MKIVIPFFLFLFVATSLQAQQEQVQQEQTQQEQVQPEQTLQHIKPFYKNTIKTTFLSFFTGSAKLTYERATWPRQSFEITGGYIGVGYDKFKVNPKGGLVRVAYKFIFAPSLSGFYVKPEYAFSAFYLDAKNGDRVPSYMQTIMANGGYQWIIKRFVLDGFAGIGVGWGNKTELNYHHGFIDYYGWLTLTFGIRLGVAF